LERKNPFHGRSDAAFNAYSHNRQHLSAGNTA